MQNGERANGHAGQRDECIPLRMRPAIMHGRAGPALGFAPRRGGEAQVVHALVQLGARPDVPWTVFPESARDRVTALLPRWHPSGFDVSQVLQTRHA